MTVCEFCGRPTNTTHHLIFGQALRRLADDDHIYMKVCDLCHNMNPKPEDRIHGNPKAEKLSKMLGQALWENQELAKGTSQYEARLKFMNRYGRSYL